MSKILIFLLFLAGSSTATAQDFPKIRELEAELAKTSDINKKLDIHLQLYHLYEIYDVQKSIENTLAAYEIAKASNKEQQMIDAAYYTGKIYQYDINNADLATQWQLKALQFSEAQNDSLRITDCSYCLGQLMFDQGDTSRAIRYIDRALNIATVRSDFTMVAMASLEAAGMTAQKEYIINYLHKALEAATKMGNDTVILANAYVELGNYYYQKKESTTAKPWYQKAMNIIDISGYKDNLFLAELYATACLRTGRNDHAILAANKLLSSAKQANGSEWYSLQGQKILAEAYFQNGYDSLAFSTLLNYIERKDSADQKKMNIRAQQIALSLQSGSDTKIRETELQLLQTQQTYQQRIAYLLTLAFLLVTALSVYLYRRRQIEHKQNKKLAQLNQTKDKLLSIISHDVRSPIQALQNIITLFEQEIATKEDVRTVTHQVNNSIQGMAQGLDNLFYWAQSQQEELKAHPEPIWLKEIISNTADLFTTRMKAKSIDLTIDIPDNVYALSDPLHTRLIISNLLVNAIKFTPTGGTIKISVSTIQGKAILKVQDSGVGMHEADIHKILDPAIRYTRPGTAGEPGSGLGLSLTRDLVHLNGNTIEFQSEIGKGTTVIVTFQQGYLA